MRTKGKSSRQPPCFAQTLTALNTLWFMFASPGTVRISFVCVLNEVF